MSNIDQLCKDYIYYATQARQQRHISDASAHTLEQYLHNLASDMMQVADNPYKGHKPEYEAAYLALAVVGPLNGVHAKDMAKHFRFYAQRCIQQGVDPDMHGIIREMAPIFRENESAIVARKDYGGRNSKNGNRSHRQGR